MKLNLRRKDTRRRKARSVYIYTHTHYLFRVFLFLFFLFLSRKEKDNFERGSSCVHVTYPEQMPAYVIEREKNLVDFLFPALYKFAICISGNRLDFLPLHSRVRRRHSCRSRTPNKNGEPYDSIVSSLKEIYVN